MVRRLFSASLFGMLARMFSTLSNLFMFFFISRFWGSATLGDYSIAFAFIQLFGISVSMGLSLFLSKELARFREDPAQSAAYFRETMAVSGNGTLLAMFFLMLAMLFYHPISSGLLLLAFAGGVLAGIENNLGGLLLALEKMPREACVQVGILLFLGTLPWLPSQRPGLSTLLALRIVLSTAAIGGRIWFLRKSWPRHFWSLKLKFWSEEKFYLFSILIDMLERNADVLILPFFLSKAQLGDYSLAVRLYFACALVAEVFANVLTPFISRVFHGHEDKDFGRFAREVGAAGLAVGFVMGLILNITAKPVLLLFQPNCGAEPVRMLHLLAWAVPFRFSHGLFGAFLTSTRFQSWRTAVSSVIVIGFTLSIVWLLNVFGPMGIVGARVGMDVAFFLTFFFLLFFKLLGPRGILARQDVT